MLNVDNSQLMKRRYLGIDMNSKNGKDYQQNYDFIVKWMKPVSRIIVIPSSRILRFSMAGILPPGFGRQFQTGRSQA